MPSGVFYDHTTSVIGNGVALNIPVLFDEIKSITDKNVPMPKIKVSDRAQIVMPYHILFDQYEEERLGKNSFGSTKSGIAPFYSDKYAKIGFQVNELFDEERLLGTTQEVLIEEKIVRDGEELQIGHTKEYVKIGVKNPNNLINQLVNVEIENQLQILH